MECHQCGRRVERGDRFCNGCGISLHAATDTPTDMPPDGEANDEPSGSEHSEGARTALIPVLDEPEASNTSGEPPDARTELIPVLDDPPDEQDDEQDDDADDDPDDELDGDPTWAPTGEVPQTPPATPATGELPETEPITEVRMAPVAVAPDPTTVTPYDFAASEAVGKTGEVAVQPTRTAQMPTVAVVTQHAVSQEPSSRFRVGSVTVIALVTGAVAMVALFADVLSITSDVRLEIGPNTPDGFRTGTWILDDFADNLSIAGLIAVILMVVGGLGAGFHWRWGSGLAGGAGLSLAGLAALAVGLAQMPIDAAHSFAAIPSETPFVLTITRDLGYWLLVVAGALGVVLFFATLNDAFGDRRSGLNPWIAALGALAVVVSVAGPLLPEEQAVFSDNWYLVDGPGEAPALLLVGRLAQLGLLLLGGVLGFLSVRRWGLGVAAGVALPVIWLTVSVLFDLTDRPVGPGFRNPGASDMHVHGVTTIGVSALLAMVLLGAVAAFDQGVRERR